MLKYFAILATCNIKIDDHNSANLFKMQNTDC